jgi:F1F0 ATPase subunit 2
MTESLRLIVASGVGILLGVFFFGGLWWTVRKSVASGQPALWFLVSMLVRTAIVLLGFYALGVGDWKRLVACLMGFILGRAGITWFTRTASGALMRAAREAGHAP